MKNKFKKKSSSSTESIDNFTLKANKKSDKLLVQLVFCFFFVFFEGLQAASCFSLLYQLLLTPAVLYAEGQGGAGQPGTEDPGAHSYKYRF